MKNIHFLGIGGSGASAVAAIAMAQGYQITGCDRQPFNEFTKIFNKKILLKDHSARHLKDVDLLAVTPAIFSLDPNNSELAEAKRQQIPILTWQQFMGKYLEKNKFVIAVCGTHGKSTTTAMVGQLLEDAGLDPTVELGAIVPRWETNYKVGKSKYFVSEADEFNDNFLASHPDITIVTTIEMDHPEYFKDFKTYQDSFRKFLNQTKKLIVANLSDPVVRKLLAFHPKGVNTIIDYSKELINFPLQVPGQYNVFNASAAFQVGLALGIKPEIITKSLSTYSGIGKRFEYMGDYHGAKVYNDFAHHPTEIRVTMQAAREKFPKQRIIFIFQPHMFSRTKVLFNEFVRVFKNIPVDISYIMDIYPGREVNTGIVSSQQLVKAVSRENVCYLGTSDLVESKLKNDVKAGDILFFASAGDVSKLARKLAK